MQTNDGSSFETRVNYQARNGIFSLYFSQMRVTRTEFSSLKKLVKLEKNLFQMNLLTRIENERGVNWTRLTWKRFRIHKIHPIRHWALFLWQKKEQLGQCKRKGGAAKNSKFYWIESKSVALMSCRWNECLKCDHILLRRCELSRSVFRVAHNKIICLKRFFSAVIMCLQSKSLLNPMMKNNFRTIAGNIRRRVELTPICWIETMNVKIKWRRKSNENTSILYLFQLMKYFRSANTNTESESFQQTLYRYWMCGWAASNFQPCWVFTQLAGAWQRQREREGGGGVSVFPFPAKKCFFLTFHFRFRNEIIIYVVAECKQRTFAHLSLFLSISHFLVLFRAEIFLSLFPFAPKDVGQKWNFRQSTKQEHSRQNRWLKINDARKYCICSVREFFLCVEEKQTQTEIKCKCLCLLLFLLFRLVVVFFVEGTKP